METKIEKKFRYNGAELAMMKKLANTSDPHMAVESFISESIVVGMDPQDRLKIAMSTQGDEDGREA